MSNAGVHNPSVIDVVSHLLKLTSFRLVWSRNGNGIAARSVYSSFKQRSKLFLIYRWWTVGSNVSSLFGQACWDEVVLFPLTRFRNGCFPTPGTRNALTTQYWFCCFAAL